MSHPTTRFSSRVNDYIQYRPNYPADVLQLLKDECLLANDSVIAEIGSGTGILTQHFLENGNTVFAVEPNNEMRAAAEQEFSGRKNFHSIAATAEGTTLAPHFCDLIVAAQSAHWFNGELARREFIRIGKPSAFTALIWNERSIESSAFLREYEQLLRTFGTDYMEVRAKVSEAVHGIFAAAPFRTKVFPNHQQFDLTSLTGRLLSSSYTPKSTDPRHAPMLTELRRLFETHQSNGQVTFEYETRIYYGQLS
ncbi:MAG: Methyltransferase [Acidobacteriales bacterium]|nr:Methyltransferase [Terriglobales bacterium]